MHEKAIEMADYHRSSISVMKTERVPGLQRILKNDRPGIEKISMASAQKEYFNNPIVLGKVFQKLNYGKMQPLHKYKFLIAYTDPSYKSGKRMTIKLPY